MLLLSVPLKNLVTHTEVTTTSFLPGTLQSALHLALLIVRTMPQDREDLHSHREEGGSGK